MWELPVPAFRGMVDGFKTVPAWYQVFINWLKTGRKTTYNGRSGIEVKLGYGPVAGASGAVPHVMRALRTAAIAVGWNEVASWFIPDGLLAQVGLDLWPFDGGFDIVPGTWQGDTMHPGVVTKQWTANGVPFVRLADGRMGAAKKDGTWRYWRPRKPIVLYASGSSDLRTLLRADKAAEKQLRTLKKAIDRRFPARRRRRSSTGHTHGDGDIIIESGAGSVAHRK